MRKNLSTLIRKLIAIEGIEDLALTTNGVLLAAAGRRSFTTPDCGASTSTWIRWTASASCKITRRDDLHRVLEGIEACRRLGYGPIKINAVAVKNLVEPDIVPLARFGRERDIEIRYIEFMPLDAQGLWERDRVLTGG